MSKKVMVAHSICVKIWAGGGGSKKIWAMGEKGEQFSYRASIKRCRFVGYNLEYILYNQVLGMEKGPNANFLFESIDIKFCQMSHEHLRTPQSTPMRVIPKVAIKKVLIYKRMTQT